MNDCPRCSRPAGDGFVCSTCATEASRHLLDIAELAKHFDDKRARSGSNWNTDGGGRAAEKPLPFDPRVTRTAAPIHKGLVNLAMLVVNDRAGVDPGNLTAASDSSSIAAWLATQTSWLRLQHYADGQINFIDRSHASITRLFDNPPEALYIGPCGTPTCMQSLYAQPGAETAKCVVCSAEVTVSERRDQLKESMRGYLGTAVEIVRLCRRVYALDLTSAVIRGYVRRGRLVAAGVTKEMTMQGAWREASTFRIGEVLDLLDKADDQEIKRAGKDGAAA